MPLIVRSRQSPVNGTGSGLAGRTATSPIPGAGSDGVSPCESQACLADSRRRGEAERRKIPLEIRDLWIAGLRRCEHRGRILDLLEGRHFSKRRVLDDVGQDVEAIGLRRPKGQTGLDLASDAVAAHGLCLLAAHAVGGIEQRSRGRLLARPATSLRCARHSNAILRPIFGDGLRCR